MVSSMISIKAALISTGIAALSLFLKYSVPIGVDFSVSRFPIIWSSFLSWLKPPYLFVVANVIIAIIVAFSKYHQSIEDQEESEDDDNEILQCGEYKSRVEPIVVTQAPLEMKDVNLDTNSDFAAEVVYEEEISSGLINGEDELKSELNHVPSTIEESENLTPAEARSGHRKPVKTISKGGNNKKKALRVVKPKRHEKIDDTWKMVTEVGKATTLTSGFRRSETFVLGAGGDVKPVLRKAETFKDVTNNHRQSSTTMTVKMKKKKKKKEIKMMSPSRDELNRRVEAFIKKCKEESLRSEKEFVA
ncbi:hypothetical protein CARUB_v10009857mg [Capsella rubella]|uniref:DUF4408 domain-containing protein n=1 Tax=Capsella rubella TaxID=81985 RepID=R0IMN1_9BRAS|nr:uncharacterized protein LOC17899245 [Capsella rubella]EOA38343.1 hypothetical protein CARUB_v10009857mg [Capsella rubella]